MGAPYKPFYHGCLLYKRGLFGGVVLLWDFRGPTTVIGSQEIKVSLTPVESVKVLIGVLVPLHG